MSAEAEVYDVNFCFPVRELESDKVKLTPLIPSLHTQAYWAGTKDHPGMYIHLPMAPFPSAAAFTDLINTRVQSDPSNIVFAVLDKTRADLPLAGLVGLLGTSPADLSTELGWLVTLPAFQRTHTTTHAVGLLLAYCLDLPEEGGLGLRRVQYRTHVLNGASIRVAERFGFGFEMVQKATRAVEGKPKGEEGGWDVQGSLVTRMYALCWDDWEGGGRERLRALLARTW
ncbi:hypothetical protein EIP91_009368 [Steccherinum ochraceum]|uniref:N-acetyltransferase domain-containing protein n=1 Tax=Steccherinum ochraceum TaxID=92696 RepID=A0A4R0R1R7_9APHY|nr:hypothetical protein EIP91_009368 [Steccherinum ochraceum]